MSASQSSGASSEAIQQRDIGTVNGSARSVWAQVEPLLLQCEKPVRYIDSEFGAIHKEGCSYRCTLLYPDTYETGLPNQGLAILYTVLNGLDGVEAQRAYVPWPDMSKLMRERNIPLYSLESCEPVKCSQMFGITLPHELSFTNVVEALDLAGIEIFAAQRGDDEPIVVGGGPCAYNCEPIADFFDCIVIGEGEQAMVDLVQTHMRAMAEGRSRAETLREFAQIDGIYVPSLYEPVGEDPDLGVRPIAGLGAPEIVRKRVLTDFDAMSPQAQPVVPFGELVHDRLAVEILRGCSRGCRFCQAGMIYRPVRERSADSVVSATLTGLACTGYDEVSLTSLSSTDHSQIEEILRRLNSAVDGQGIQVSIPSQRLDGFGVRMAHLVAGAKKGGLTFAPEAGTQRLRDIINKNVTEENLFQAISAAFDAGWRRLKLYFMIGLPFETDDDVRGIAQLANRAYAYAKDCVPDNQRGNVRMTISVAIFIPKPATPFQWCGQIDAAEAQRRVDLIRHSHLHKGIDFNWHDPSSSLVEGAFARGGRNLSKLVVEAWRRGCIFDAWTEIFSLDRWLEAAEAAGIDMQGLASRNLEAGGPLPWSHISCGVEERFLKLEYDRASEGITTPDCTFTSCTGCGVCTNLGVDIALGGTRE